MKPSCVFTFLFGSRSSDCDSQESSHFLRDYAVREINAILWVSLIAVTFFLLEKVVKLLSLWAKARRIPGPPCPSFYGHYKLISRENLTHILSDLHKKYGSVVKLWLGPAQLLISMKDPAHIEQMLLKAVDKLPLTDRAFRLAFGRLSLFVSSYDKQVHMKRESLATELDRTLLRGANVVPTKVVDSIMGRIWEGRVDRNMVSQNMSFTIMGAALFGDALLGWSKATVYEELFSIIAKDACFWASYRVTPFWKQEFWRYHSLCTKLKSLTQEIVQHSRTIEPTNIKMEAFPKASSCSGTLMPDNLYLQEVNGHPSTTEEPCGNIMGVMFHGCLTTTSLIANMLTRIVADPELQDQIYSEITMARKGSQKQDQQDVANMHLLLATIYESARLLPSGPLLQRCSLKQDLSLKPGVSLPSGAVLVVPLQLVQTDNSSWGNDASKFNPYRFLSKPVEGSCLTLMSSSTDTAGNPEEFCAPRHSSFNLNNPNDNAAFLPFGSGARACVGQKFVIHGVATLFASLLEHYEMVGSSFGPRPLVIVVPRLPFFEDKIIEYVDGKLQGGSKDDRKPSTDNCVLELLQSLEISFVKRNS